jgi:hypothetical protein
MTEFTAGASPRPQPAAPRGDGTTGVRGEAVACDLYEPGHQMHYRHQGDAMHSRSVPVRDATVDGVVLLLTLADGTRTEWRHHDPTRLRTALESFPSKRVAYPDGHAVRVGPFWFNCARESDDWQDCRTSGRQSG